MRVYGPRRSRPAILRCAKVVLASAKVEDKELLPHKEDDFRPVVLVEAGGGCGRVGPGMLLGAGHQCLACLLASRCGGLGLGWPEAGMSAHQHQGL